MRPIDKTSEDLFQKLRSRFSPISMGDENADETATPSEARIFNFMYKDGDNEIGYVSISIIDNRSFKVYYGTDLTNKIENKTDWYNLLKDLRMFAKRNLMSFDARDLAKNQLEPRDFKFISRQDGTYKEHEVEVTESVMFGSRRKSYQTMENVKMIVNHRKSIDETIPGSRSRYIESIYLERADGERYKFPYNYLTGARAMARHVNEGGNPYDDMGKHIISMIKEMRDLSKFARRTRKHAMEDENAGNIRNSVIERFHNMKKQLGAMSVKEGYARFAENFKAEEALVEDDAVQQIKERFTQQVFDTQLEDTLPAVMKAIKEAEMKQVAEADKSITMLIKSKPLVLRKDSAADQMFRTTKFTDGAGLLSFILSDIASRAIGDGADEIANFASDASERMQDKDYNPADKQTAMMLAKKYMDDVKKMVSDPSYADEIRVDPKNVYGKMKKREGGFHEAEQYESWANELVPEDYETDARDWSKKYADNERFYRGQAKSKVSLVSRISPEYSKEKTRDADRQKAISKRFAHKAVTGMDSDELPEDYDPAEKELTNDRNRAAKTLSMHPNVSKTLSKLAKHSNDRAVTGMNPNDLPESSKKKFELSKGEKHAYDQGRSRSLMKDQGEDLPYDDDTLNAAYAKGKEHYKVKEAASKKNAWHLDRDGNMTKISNKTADKMLKGPTTKKEKKDALASYLKHRKADDEAHGWSPTTEATTQGTIGTTGTSGPAALAQNLKDPNLIKQSKLAAQALKTGGVQNVNAQTVAKTLGKQASSMPLNKKDMEPVAALGAKAMQAATNPKVANQLGSLLKKAGI